MLRLSPRNLAPFTVLITAIVIAGCSKKEEAPPVAATPAEAPVAPPPAPAKIEGVESFKIGELSATALRDGGMELPNDNKVFGLGKKPEDVAAVLSSAGQPTDKLALSIQPLLVKTADKVLLFDTGAGTNFGPGAGKLGETMAAAGIDPNSVTDIFISHVHGDHVGGLVNGQGGAAFPNATVHISKPEWDYLTKLKPEAAKEIGVSDQAKLVAAVTPKVDAFTPGADLVPGVVKAVEIKGHTPGHSGYQISSGSDSVLYVGDSMHHFVISVQKPEWTMAYDGDKKTGAASRAALIEKLATDGQRVFAVHFPFPGIGKIEKQGDKFVWVPEAL
jgi:glyoxylase-like metal-dependent hydrolase (beta-lactamase superfamily II)